MFFLIRRVKNKKTNLGSAKIKNDILIKNKNYHHGIINTL